MSNFCWLMAFNEYWDVTVLQRLSLKWFAGLLALLMHCGFLGCVMWMFMKIIPHQVGAAFSVRLILSLVPCTELLPTKRPFLTLSYCYTCYWLLSGSCEIISLLNVEISLFPFSLFAFAAGYMLLLLVVYHIEFYLLEANQCQQATKFSFNDDN